MGTNSGQRLSGRSSRLKSATWPRAVVVVHQFRPRDLDAAAGTGDKRDWATAFNENADAFAAFAIALEASGSTSLETEFVEAGTRLDVLKVESYVDV
jgi:hypothetical protein